MISTESSPKDTPLAPVENVEPSSNNENEAQEAPQEGITNAQTAISETDLRKIQRELYEARQRWEEDNDHLAAKVKYPKPAKKGKAPKNALIYVIDRSRVPHAEFLLAEMIVQVKSKKKK